MHTFAVTSALLASALLSSAIPTGTADVAPRACTTQYPSFISHIYEVAPDLTNEHSNVVEVAYDTVNGPGTRLYRRDLLVQFDNIPVNSYGCQLEAYFPAGGFVNQYGASQVNVFTVDKAATLGDSWNTAPKPVSLFGTVTFEAKGSEAVTRVINSAVCSDTLTYRISIASETQVGEVYFPEGPDANGQGLRLTHNC